MPQVSAEVRVPVDPGTAFAVSQATGETRLLWDPFIRRQYFLDGATTPAKDVRTRTFARLGPSMVSRYVSYNPPRQVGMTMVQGPWFFAQFGGGWRFLPDGDGTRAVWKYTYSIRPAWLRPVAEPIGLWRLGRESRRRIEAFARGCTDPRVLAAVGGTDTD
jgi:hypothetical protein